MKFKMAAEEEVEVQELVLEFWKNVLNQADLHQCECRGRRSPTWVLTWINTCQKLIRVHPSSMSLEAAPAAPSLENHELSAPFFILVRCLEAGWLPQHLSIQDLSPLALLGAACLIYFQGVWLV